MIIVEGPDGAGKTTLARTLSEQLQIPIAPKVVSSDAEIHNDLMVWVSDNLRKGFHPVIYDRHRLISEPIYGPVLRSHLQDGFEDFGWLSSKLQQLRRLEPIIIWCLPPVDTVLQNIASLKQPPSVVDNILAVYWLYHHAAASWASEHRWVWDYTNPTVKVEFMAGYIKQIIKEYS